MNEPCRGGCNVTVAEDEQCLVCGAYMPPALTTTDTVAAVLRTFPGSVIAGMRLKDPAECHDDE